MLNKCYKPGIFLVIALILNCLVFFEIGFSAQAYNALIEEKCVHCHNFDRIYYNKMSLARWANTIKRMQAKRPGWIMDKQAESVFAVLTTNNLIESKFLFEKKCLDCHERKGQKSKLYMVKTRQGWKRAIKRMRKKFCMFIGIDEAEEITIYWTDPKNNNNLKLNETDYDLLEGGFEEKCGACHSYKFIYHNKYRLNDWIPILKRMQQKSPAIIKKSDLKDIKDYLLQTESLLVK